MPLSDRAMEVLKEAWEISGPDGLVFPSRPGGKAASDMTMNVLLRRLGVPAVPHGFRRSFRNWAAERMKGWAEEAEAALAHQVKNKTEAAYLTTDLFDNRIVLMQKWADYVAFAGDLNSEVWAGIGANAKIQEKSQQHGKHMTPPITVDMQCNPKDPMDILDLGLHFYPVSKTIKDCETAENGVG